MTEYIRRIVDDELDELLSGLSALALEGPKGVGKTATAERRVATTFRLDVPAQRILAAADPEVLLRAEPPILIDEWQHVPAVWDAVRRAVDRDATPNHYLLAGSAAPMAPPTHSGAGRIVSVRLRPLALSERGLAEPSVSLADLLGGSRPPVSGHTTIGLADYAREVITSGFPGLRHLAGRALRAQLDGYLARVVDRDFVEQGYSVRKPEALRRWMAAYAAATATTTSLAKIRDAATGGEGETPTKVTTGAYREVLDRLWITDPVPGWLPSRNHLARLTQAPKHHLADPALAARLLGVDEGALLTGATAGALGPRDGTLLGQLFESLVTLSMRAYAQAGEATVRHLRTKEGRQEIDLIVERPDQRVLGVETKLSATVTDDDVRHLLWLREVLGEEVLDLVVVTTGSHAYRRPDGVAIVPAVLLGP
ncbi:MAG: ATP-binding protein [Gemmatimonadales bacterium]|nr:MAG: ATP-binding protein [Gemmatimonadales bacterium]